MSTQFPSRLQAHYPILEEPSFLSADLLPSLQPAAHRPIDRQSPYRLLCRCRSKSASQFEFPLGRVTMPYESACVARSAAVTAVHRDPGTTAAGRGPTRRSISNGEAFAGHHGLKQWLVPAQRLTRPVPERATRETAHVERACLASDIRRFQCRMTKRIVRIRQTGVKRKPKRVWIVRSPSYVGMATVPFSRMPSLSDAFVEDLPRHACPGPFAVVVGNCDHAVRLDAHDGDFVSRVLGCG